MRATVLTPILDNSLDGIKLKNNTNIGEDESDKMNVIWGTTLNITGNANMGGIARNGVSAGVTAWSKMVLMNQDVGSSKDVTFKKITSTDEVVSTNGYTEKARSLKLGYISSPHSAGSFGYISPLPEIGSYGAISASIKFSWVGQTVTVWFDLNILSLVDITSIEMYLPDTFPVISHAATDELGVLVWTGLDVGTSPTGIAHVLTNANAAKLTLSRHNTEVWNCTNGRIRGMFSYYTLGSLIGDL